jgi:hypothetical protein
MKSVDEMDFEELARLESQIYNRKTELLEEERLWEDILNLLLEYVNIYGKLWISGDWFSYDDVKRWKENDMPGNITLYD